MKAKEVVIKKRGLHMSQDGVEMVLSNFSVSELIENTMVDIFDGKLNENGYQRPLNENHVDAIYEYFKLMDFSILPTSIILAINKEDIKITQDIIIKNSFRVIDGQHRIAAMKKYKKVFESDKDVSKEEIQEYMNFIKWEYPVTIMLLNKEEVIDRYVEVRCFVDINKKGRKVSTDLADNNIYKITSQFESLHYKEAVHNVTVMAINIMNEDEKSVWYDVLKTGDERSENYLVGISAFKLSILSLGRKVLIERFGKQEIYTKKQIKISSENLVDVISKLWISVCEKWDGAFLWNENLNTYRADFNYSIQKTLGVTAIHRVLKHHCKGFSLDKALDLAIIDIKNSDILSRDWQIGGRFSKLSSSSGQSEIRDIILRKD